MSPAKPKRGEPGRDRNARADARRDPGKLKENQERLGVDPEHKTAEMRKGRRGTFP